MNPNNIQKKLDVIAETRNNLKGEKTEKKFLDREASKERYKLSKMADQWLANNGKGR